VLKLSLNSLLLIAILIVGCSSQSRLHYQGGITHIVRTGETLSSIAAFYHKDFRDLARWNNLGDGALIYPGQLIYLVEIRSGTVARSVPKLSEISRAPDDPAPHLSWPTTGHVIKEFNGTRGTGTGMLIKGKGGQPIRAAASGHVVYSGDGLVGYGKLIIVKHNDTFLSAYGHNASLLVEEGQNIAKGQQIATMGEVSPNEHRLHFEIRRNGEPVNPRQFLSNK
tara:strand:+ start:2876 stop:3547 length:672 start_codon:yes stop_codon:yes gene_type:complete